MTWASLIATLVPAILGWLAKEVQLIVTGALAKKQAEAEAALKDANAQKTAEQSNDTSGLLGGVRPK